MIGEGNGVLLSKQGGRSSAGRARKGEVEGGSVVAGVRLVEDRGLSERENSALLSARYLDLEEMRRDS